MSVHFINEVNHALLFSQTSYLDRCSCYTPELRSTLKLIYFVVFVLTNRFCVSLFPTMQTTKLEFPNKRINDRNHVGQFRIWSHGVWHCAYVFVDNLRCEHVSIKCKEMSFPATQGRPHGHTSASGAMGCGMFVFEELEVVHSKSANVFSLCVFLSSSSFGFENSGPTTTIPPFGWWG